MALEEDDVKVESKEYDLECVQWLSVTNLDFRDVSVLSKCPNLIELDISHNNIFSLRGLEGLAFLRVLNAAHNKVSDLSKLAGCVALEKLLLQGNDITSLESLPELPKLRQLTLRTGHEASNPIYDSQSDTEAIDTSMLQFISERWPTVFIFNGSHTTFAKSAAEMLLDLVGPKPNTSGQEQDGGGWLDNFEWGEYFDANQFEESYRPIEQDIVSVLDELKQLDRKDDQTVGT